MYMYILHIYIYLIFPYLTANMFSEVFTAYTFIDLFNSTLRLSHSLDSIPQHEPSCVFKWAFLEQNGD